MTANRIAQAPLMVVALCAVLFTASCSKDSAETMDLWYDMGDFSMYDMLVTGEAQLVHHTTFEPELTASFNTLSASSITLNEILLDEMTLSVTSPSGGTFNGVSYFVVYMVAEDLDTIEIGSVDGLSSANATSAAITSNGYDLDEYFKKDECQLLIYAYNTSPVGIMDQVRVGIDFQVAADITITE